ncbi:MAG: hypothetical protein GY810_32125 [Aureispira sp.]|nr:hypothetical protein [Aureispira sp.]
MQTKFFGILMLIAIMAISCGKERGLLTDKDKKGEKYGDKCGDKDDWDDKDDCDCDDDDDDNYWEEECFYFVYPLSIVYTDGTTKSITSEEELDMAWEACEKDATTEDEICFDFVYPVKVKFEDGTIKEMANEEELDRTWEDCEGDWEEEICFDFVYPLSITHTDGTTQSITTDEEFQTAWDNCDNATTTSTTGNDRTNDEEKCFDLVYPISITFEDGTTKSITTDEELEMAFDSCFDDYKGSKGKDDYKKITKKLNKSNGCQYITEGTIEYYNKKDMTLQATIDFGDGTCDNVATKTLPDGTVYTIEADYFE